LCAFIFASEPKKLLVRKTFTSSRNKINIHATSFGLSYHIEGLWSSKKRKLDNLKKIPDDYP
jgi:hypothetical protein